MSSPTAAGPGEHAQDRPRTQAGWLHDQSEAGPQRRRGSRVAPLGGGPDCDGTVGQASAARGRHGPHPGRGRARLAGHQVEPGADQPHPDSAAHRRSGSATRDRNQLPSPVRTTPSAIGRTSQLPVHRTAAPAPTDRPAPAPRNQRAERETPDHRATRRSGQPPDGQTPRR